MSPLVPMANGWHLAGNDKTVRLWDTQSLQSQGELKGHTSYVTSVAFSPDGKRLASGSCDKTVRLWDPQSLQSQGELKGHTDSVIVSSLVPMANGWPRVVMIRRCAYGILKAFKAKVN